MAINMSDIKNFIKGFGYAVQGIIYTLHNERNLRFHISIFFYMLFFLLRFDFFVVSKLEFSVLLLMSAIIISLELVNTGIEKAVDTATDKKVESAKYAKDAAAGAVLVSAIFAVVIGIIILFQPPAFYKLFNWYAHNPVHIVILGIIGIADGFYIFAGPKKIINKFKK